jgi:hypothetical protein
VSATPKPVDRWEINSMACPRQWDMKTGQAGSRNMSSQVKMV